MYIVKIKTGQKTKHLSEFGDPFVIGNLIWSSNSHNNEYLFDQSIRKCGTSLILFR